MTRIESPRHPGLWPRAFFFLCRRLYGRVFRPLQVAAHVPSFLVPYAMTNRFAHGRGELPPDTRLLAMLLMAERNGCSWCIDYGRSLAGADLRDKVSHLLELETYPAFTAAERAALRYAFESSQVPIAVSDETFAELRRHFSERQIVELTFAIAIESFFNRVNAPLGVEAEGFCALPPSKAAA